MLTEGTADDAYRFIDINELIALLADPPPLPACAAGLGVVVAGAPGRRPVVLSPLQERAARLISALPEAAGFALAGGAALVIRGLVDRTTRDLDFFSTDPAVVERLLMAVEAALDDAGLDVERERVAEGFARGVGLRSGCKRPHGQPRNRL